MVQINPSCRWRSFPFADGWLASSNLLIDGYLPQKLKAFGMHRCCLILASGADTDANHSLGFVVACKTLSQIPMIDGWSPLINNHQSSLTYILITLIRNSDPICRWLAPSNRRVKIPKPPICRWLTPSNPLIPGGSGPLRSLQRRRPQQRPERSDRALCGRWNGAAALAKRGEDVEGTGFGGQDPVAQWWEISTFDAVWCQVLSRQSYMDVDEHTHIYHIYICIHKYALYIYTGWWF